MTSARANRGSGLRSQPVDPTPFRPAFRVAMDAYSGPIAAPLSLEAQEQLVLRGLVERFGGEVTYAALTRYLTQISGRTQPEPSPKFIDVMQTLHRCGAVSLEANGENDFIVRLLPEGANRCA